MSRRPRRWPFPHVWRFVVFAGGWAAYDCERCGIVGIGGCWFEKLFRPCRPRGVGR